MRKRKLTPAYQYLTIFRAGTALRTNATNANVNASLKTDYVQNKCWATRYNPATFKLCCTCHNQTSDTMTSKGRNEYDPQKTDNAPHNRGCSPEFECTDPQKWSKPTIDIAANLVNQVSDDMVANKYGGAKPNEFTKNPFRADNAGDGRLHHGRIQNTSNSRGSSTSSLWFKFEACTH